MMLLDLPKRIKDAFEGKLIRQNRKGGLTMSVIELTQENYQKEVIESDRPVLIDFFATWCGPCKMVSPVVDEIAVEHPEIKVCKLDVDRNMDLARTFQVMSVPTLVAMKDGQVINKSIGAASKANILKMFA